MKPPDHIWEAISGINSERFKRFVTKVTGIVFGSTKAVAIVYDSEKHLFFVMHYAHYKKECKIVAKCNIRWLKKILLKCFPDRDLYQPVLVECPYKMIIGYIEEFLSEEGFQININYSTKKDCYTFSIATLKKSGMPVYRAYGYNQHKTYEGVHKDAVRECWKKRRKDE